MTPQALVIDQHALNILSSAEIRNEWFTTFPRPEGNALKRIELDEVCYILSNRADEKSRLLVVNSSERGIFATVVSPRHAFERIVHVALT